MRATATAIWNLFGVFAIIGLVHAETTFKYVTSYQPEGIYMQAGDLHRTSVNVLKPIIFLIASAEERTRCATAELATAYLDKYITNVFIVEWPNNTTAKPAESVGGDVAHFIARIFNTTGERHLDVRLVGCTVGGQVAVEAAKQLQLLRSTGGRRSVNRITHLDPSGCPINGEDATKTDVVRSQWTEERCGDLEFIIYAGNCSKDPTTNCTKAATTTTTTTTAAAARLLARSINSGAIMAIKCESLIHFQSGRCANGERIVLGENAPAADSKGTFFVPDGSA